MNQSITYQNHKINVLTEGNGEAIIFLHGWPTNSKLWAAQVEKFKKNYKVIALDWLGFGASSNPTEHQYTFTKKKEFLDAVITEVLGNNEKVNIVAHDVGGPPAILWASENEEQVNRLILLNTVIYPFSTSLDKLSHVLFNIPIIKDILVSPFGLKRIMKMNTRSGNPEINKRIQDVLEGDEHVKSAIKLQTILEPLNEGRKNELLSISEKFRKLSIKKYLVIAKEDPLCYKHIKQLSIENPEVPTFYIQDCGHYIPIDQPVDLNEILAKILKEKI